MNYKSIFKAVGVVSVAAVFSIGCGNNDDDDGNGGGGGGGGGGSGGLVGDWSIVESTYDRDGEVGTETIPDDTKMFYSFTSSNDVVATEFNKISDFWIESIQEVGKYSIKGDSICVDGDCIKYSISGNTLTLSNSYQDCYDGKCYSYSSSMKAVKANIADTKKTLGKVYGRDAKLEETTWRMESNGIHFCTPEFEDWNEFYASGSEEFVWHTEGSRIIVVGVKCTKSETVKDEWEEWEECVSYATDKTITLDYQLTNGTLRLKAPDKDWDVWTSDDDDDDYMYKSKAKSKKDRRHVNPFKVFRK